MELGSVTLLTGPGEVPDDPAQITDDTLINVAVWAGLQGVKKATVEVNRSRHNARRGTPEAKAGDMPVEDQMIGNSPYWLMGTYRAWVQSRPGPRAGGGRPKGTGGKAHEKPRLRTTLQFPGVCPHCGETIRARDIKGSSEPSGPVEQQVEGTGTRRKKVRAMPLPAPCPHCHREIRGQDLAEAGK